MSTDRQRRVRELFDAALEQPAEVRLQFLSAACAGDQQLEDTVERLLAAHQRSVGILDTPIRERQEHAAVRHAEGSFIAAYKIIREIGAGGMGVVYQAVRADEVFQRVCAIKVIRAELSSPRLLQQFRQERQVLAKLDHAHIARIVDGGSTPEGLPFFVMDYVDGPPISTYCSQHGLSIPARLTLFQQVCSAVQYLHLNGIIHGDLKPPNMLVGNDGSVRIVDFGIASALSAQGSRDLPIPLMTPGYASPEQMTGKPLTPASDVFSLGVVLYELLTGLRPLQLADGSRRELIAMQNVPPPSTVTIRPGNIDSGNSVEVRSPVNAEMDCIVLRAMQPDPAQRYQSAAELTADISAYLQGRPVNARGKSVVYATRKFLTRNRAAVATGLVMAVLLATASWEAVRIRELKLASEKPEGDTRKQQQNSIRAQQEVLARALTHSESSAGSSQTEQQANPSKHPAHTAQDHNNSLPQTQLRDSELQQRELQGLRELAEAYRTSFSESVRIWPFMTPSRRSLLEQAQNYLQQAEPIAANNPQARQELARAWMYLANIQGNPQTPNLHDHAGAVSSIKQALRLLEGTPGASADLRRQVQLAAQQIGAVH